MTHPISLVTHLAVALLSLAPALRALPSPTPNQQDKVVPLHSQLLSGGSGKFSVSAIEAAVAAKRVRRSTDHIISECMTVTSEEGQYFFKGDTGGETCGVYLLTDPDRRVHLTLDYLDIPCGQGGLVTLFDGWELNREFFPSEAEHPLPLRQRFLEFCSGGAGLGLGAGNSATSNVQRPGKANSKRSLITAQNAALVQFRVPQRSRGFSVTVRFPRNPTPCNILLEGSADVYTLRNYGKPVNCSLATLFPARVTVLSLSVGMTSSKRNMALETGTIHKCEKRGLPDYVEVGGAEGLDTRRLAVAESICGLDSRPGSTEETILCGVTAVRLISSGGFDNAVTVALRPASEEDIAGLVCGM